MTMMNSSIPIYDAINKHILREFQTNKGHSFIYCYDKVVYCKIIQTLINAFIEVDCNRTICIFISNYEIRNILKNTINKAANVSYVSTDYIKTNFNYNYDLNIIIGNLYINDIDFINNESRFCFYIQTKYNLDFEYKKQLNNILKEIDISNYLKKIKENTIYSPVEETHVRVELSDEDRTTYDNYTEYITTSMNLFGSFDNIEKCRVGDKELNISATEMCNSIAKANGWREDLDVTIPYQKDIDDVFNPNSLYERANNFYNISKLRRDLVSDNTCKFDAIKNIVLSHPDEKILIVSKRGEFASKLTEYLNTDAIICGDYHDTIEPRTMNDENGCPILIKSGKDKGQPRIFKSKAISTLNERLFNDDSINVLSIKNSSNNELKIACDRVIITSTLCDDIIGVKKRFTNIYFENNPTKVSVICCNNTIESDKLNKESTPYIIKIIDDYDNIIDFD